MFALLLSGSVELAANHNFDHETDCVKIFWDEQPHIKHGFTIVTYLRPASL